MRMAVLALVLAGCAMKAAPAIPEMTGKTDDARRGDSYDCIQAADAAHPSTTEWVIYPVPPLLAPVDLVAQMVVNATKSDAAKAADREKLDTMLAWRRAWAATYTDCMVQRGYVAR